ncbi:MAG TPA: benzoate-CoA ligase family protein [Vicinamibacterales bacterium]|nr:benzoate-CoA ligase family protein [Vicinamibacterales bacterium]
MTSGTSTQLNLATYFLDARLEQGAGHRVAIREASRTHTYRQVAAASARMAHVLEAEGIRPEERVIIALPDGAAFVESLFAVLRSGAVVVMVNPDSPVELLTYFCEYTRAGAVVLAGTHASIFHDAVRNMARPPRLLNLDDHQMVRAREQAVTMHHPFPSHADDAAIWLFSGGTTGRPKAVVQTNRSFANTTELYGKGVLGLTPDDITLSVPKLFFGYALGSNVFFPFSVGASCVLFPERSTPDTVLAAITRHRPTVLITVPTMVQQMVSHQSAASYDLSSLRLATSAGEALPAQLYARWQETFGVELLDGLGTAEMWHIFLSNRPGQVVPGTLGHVVPGFEVKLCDGDGREVPDGEVGALWVKGDSRAIAYWQRMDETMRAFQGEWYVSGDMLRKNADGTFVYCGRADDMLKVSGKWLAPGELENCLLQHGQVREVAVVGVTNADGLVKPCAFVVSDAPSPALAAELQEFAKSRLEPYKYPRDIVFVDSLPRTHLGKVDRHALAASQRVKAD